jgi:rare lipoprotein A
MRYAIRGIGALALAAGLTSCGSFDGQNDSGALKSVSTEVPVQQGVSDEPVKIGTPFTVGAVTYTPRDVPAYDEVGYASYYGQELKGQPTANGEIFNPTGASAAHKTLPLPSYVEVTALDTGRTILVRINDRGPFANDRLIDLSEGAARQLGIVEQGVTGVRVRRVNPPEQEKAVLRQGITAAERIDTPGPLLKVLRDMLAKLPKPNALAQNVGPAPVKAPAAPATTVSASDDRVKRENANAPAAKTAPLPRATVATGDYVAQIGAFSSRANADALAEKLGASVTKSSDGKLYRVRLGPFTSQSEATAAARQKGYPQARVYRD